MDALMATSNANTAAAGRRGQAALEFLTTYGWVFLIILVVIAAFSYFGVLSPSRTLPDKCILGNVLVCKDFRVLSTGTPNGQIDLMVNQNKGETIFITAISASTEDFGTSTSCTVNGQPLPGEVEFASTATMNVSCALSGGGELPIANFVGDKIEVTVSIQYHELRSKYAKEEKGDIYGTVQ